MPRKIRKKKTLLGPLAQNLGHKLSTADARQRRRIMRIGCLVVGLWLVWTTMVGSYSIPRIIRLHLEKQRLIETNRALVIQLVDMQRLRGMLQSNPRYIEQVARIRYRMARPDETIYFYHRH